MKKIDFYVENHEDTFILSELAGYLLQSAHYREPWDYEFSLVVNDGVANIDYGMKGIARYCEMRHSLGKSDNPIDRSICKFRETLHNCGKDLGKISFNAELAIVNPELKRLLALRVYNIVLYEK